MWRQVMGPEIVPAQSGPAWKSFPQGDLVSRKTRCRAGFLSAGRLQAAHTRQGWGADWGRAFADFQKDRDNDL